MTTDPLSRYLDRRSLVLLASIFVSYVLTGSLGFQIHQVNTFATLVWPPVGIAFAAFLMHGHRVWPAVFLAALAVNTSLGASLPVALFLAGGNTMGPFVGALLVRWYTDYKNGMLRLGDNISIILSALLVPLLTATIGTGTLWIAGSLAPTTFTVTWSTWWLGDMLGILICAPFVLKWFAKPLFERSVLQYVELLVITASVAMTSYFIFWWPFTSFAYVLFVPLMWAALRTGPRGITLSLLLMSIVAIPGTINGYGPFAKLGLTHLQAFLGIASAIFLTFTAIVEERKETLKALKRHLDELEIALKKISSEDEAKKEFLAILAHELRNPLATILSSIELIGLRGLAAPNTTKILETIADRGHTMVHILDDLLDISRISQKKLSLQKEVLAVDELIDKFVLTMQLLVAKYGHTFSVTRPPKKLFVHADPVRLEQIFTNLIVNAVKYTKAPGTISVTVEREGDMIAARIRDTGIGIPAHMLRRIFEPFFRVDERRSGDASDEGLGIGLPLTRQLVEMHGGTIEAHSMGVDAGSEFIVRLPLHLDTAQAPRAHSDIPTFSASTRAPRKTARQFKILIVDDNEKAADTLVQLLTLRGHTTATAYTGLRALDKARELEPEIVLLDIGLPDIDGYEVARGLQEQDKSYYLIALTGYGQSEDREKARQAGFHAHLTKPAGLKEIEAALQEVPRTVEGQRG